MNLIAEARRMVPSLSRGIPFVYIMRLRSGAYYVGCSIDFEARFREHEAGTACLTTRIDIPVSLEWIEIHPDFPSVRKREAQIKKWSRAKKNALITGDMEKLKTLSKSHD